MDKNIRDFNRMLDSGGLRLLALTRTGKGHFKATIEGPDNRKLTYILANSASDHRAAMNCKKEISRFFNN
jgi:hypothetical protein